MSKSEFQTNPFGMQKAKIEMQSDRAKANKRSKFKKQKCW
jgi:hypothetical protein